MSNELQLHVRNFGTDENGSKIVDFLESLGFEIMECFSPFEDSYPKSL